jgi:hypothetical protein
MSHGIQEERSREDEHSVFLLWMVIFAFPVAVSPFDGISGRYTPARRYSGGFVSGRGFNRSFFENDLI